MMDSEELAFLKRHEIELVRELKKDWKGINRIVIEEHRFFCYVPKDLDRHSLLGWIFDFKASEKSTPLPVTIPKKQ